MEKLRFGKTGLEVSRLAFGGIPIMRLSRTEAVRVVRRALDLGINVIDTANGYTDSEEKIGEALKTYKREDVVIASKSMAKDRKTFLEHVDLSLRRLGLEYIDIYQFHNVSTREGLETILGPGGAMEGMREAMKAGKIRHPGFSSHAVPLAMEIMKTGEFETVQLPVNFIDTEAENEAIALAKKLGIGFFAMKPMGGGLLDDAGPALRYLLKYDNLVPDPGMEKIEEVEEMVRIAESPRPLTAEELREIEKIRRELGSEWCHRCDYCQPCPQGIKISSVLSLKSFFKRMPADRARLMLKEPMTKAETCTECRACAARCPYHLDIPALIKKNLAQWKELVP